MTKLKGIQQEVSQSAISFQLKPPKIVSCWISEGKLITQLSDEREISMPVSLLTKWQVLEEKVKAEQLENYELWGDGKTIFFPTSMKFYHLE